MKSFLFFITWIAIGFSFGIGFRGISKSVDWIGIIPPGIAYIAMFILAMKYKDGI
jgi:predicted membrane protein